MPNIQIGETTLMCESVSASGTLLSLFLTETNRTLGELATVFEGEPQIRVLGADGTTEALYQCYALTALSMETVGGAQKVSATLQADPVERTVAEELAERIDVQEARLDEQQQLGDMLGRMARARIQTAEVTADEVIAMAPALPAWTPASYAAGDVCGYEGVPYRCAQAHDSTENPAWTPPATPALWAPYHATVLEFALPWQMPTGAQDAYQQGEWMIFTDGKPYRCTRDGTVWGPDQVADAWEVG